MINYSEAKLITFSNQRSESVFRRSLTQLIKYLLVLVQDFTCLRCRPTHTQCTLKLVKLCLVSILHYKYSSYLICKIMVPTLHLWIDTWMINDREWRCDVMTLLLTAQLLKASGMTSVLQNTRSLWYGVLEIN